MQLSHTVSVLELAWTIFALIGVLAALYAAREHWRDRTVAIKRQMPRAAEDLAFAYLVNAMVKSVAFLTYFIAGVIAMTLPNNPVTRWSTTAIALCLIGGEASLGASLLYQQYVRRRVLRDAALLEALLLQRTQPDSLRDLVQALTARVQALEEQHS